MPLIRRDFKRRSGSRDAKLFVIASEGQKTEPKYFEDLKRFHQNHRIHIEVLKRINCSSSPQAVLKQLKKFKLEYNLNINDELWMIIDLDRWTQRNLSSIAAQCIQNNFFLAVSNPCFEIWLLLHLREISQNDHVRFSNCSILERELKLILGSYNKANLDTSRFLPSINIAIIRAKKLDVNPGHRWPNSLGTRIYKLIENLELK
jgi:hypothetical protein